MKSVRIVRLENTTQGTIGVLVINGLVECWTMQPDSSDTHFHIPSGSYVCKRFHGQKWQDTFEIVVKGHTALLFHAGNTEEDTQGCVLLGEDVGYLNGKRAVLASGKAFCEFMKKMDNEQEFNLFVQDEWRM